MPTFVSQEPYHEIAHPTLAEAADSEFFTVRFRPIEDVGTFRTDSEAIAKALRTLIGGGKILGVQELVAVEPATGDVPPAEPLTPEEVTDATAPRRGQRG